MLAANEPELTDLLYMFSKMGLLHATDVTWHGCALNRDGTGASQLEVTSRPDS